MVRSNDQKVKKDDRMSGYMELLKTSEYDWWKQSQEYEDISQVFRNGARKAKGLKM